MTNIKNLRILFLFLSSVLIFLSFILITLIKNNNINFKLKEITTSYIKVYNTVHTQYKELSEVFFSGIIYTNELDTKLKRYLNSKDKNEKDSIRNELLKQITKRYEKLKEKHISSINIVLPDNKFLLIMKDPEKYDFLASELRTDLHYVNNKKVPLETFSIGLGGSGFRFIYPIFKDKEYVGLISFTFDASAITSGIMKQYQVMSNFFFKEKYFKKEFLEKSEKYIISSHKGYLYNKEVLEELENSSRKDIQELIPSKETFLKVNNNLSKKDSSTIFDKDKNITITTIPILNIVDGEFQGILTIRAKADDLTSYILIMNLIQILLIFFILTFLYLLYRILVEKDILKKEIKNKTKELEILNSDLELIVNKKTKELEEKNKSLNEQKNFLNALIQTSPIPFFVKTIDGNYIDVNKTWIEFTGFSKEEIVGKSVYDVAPKDIADIYFEQDKKVFDLEENPQIYQSKVVNKNSKKEYSVMFYKSAFFDDNGNVKGLIGSLLDLTKIKELEEEKIKREKLIIEQTKFAQMGEMLENIAHQWRQPLSIISTIASGTKLNFTYNNINQEETIKNLDVLVDTVNYLSDTINDFKEFIKEDRELKTIILQKKIDDIMKIVDASLNYNHIKVYKNYKNCEDIKVKLLQGELTQVIINLLNNSKDALKTIEMEDKWIKIDLLEENEKAIIIIEDNAGGIKEEIITKIFNPYFTTKHQFHGTGLGLYMSKNIIEKHIKGKIYVKNSEFGAKFYIEIPLNEEI